jgi:alcohol dehydrogenase (cytochrome c)/quinohemoprotein ethanol dehydrogenase
VARGGKLYGRYCLVCHMGTFNNPVLKRSPVLGDPETMKAIVIDGALSHNGMASFRSVLTGEDVEAIRHYVIKRANDDANDDWARKR